MTNSGLQWASPETPKLLNRSGEFKLKTFTDLTQATGEATKESIQAHNLLTQQILNSIDTGQKQREDILEFYTKTAPKATGQLVDTYKTIQEGRRQFGEITKKVKLIQTGQVEDVDGELGQQISKAKEHNQVISDIIGPYSAYIESTGDVTGAIHAFNINNSSDKKELLNQIMQKVTPSVFEAMSGMSFELEDGNTYTYDSATDNADARLEIRNKVAVSIAANAWMTGKFSRNEILNGILRPLLKKNKEKYTEDLQVIAENNKKELLIKKTTLLVSKIKDGNSFSLNQYLSDQEIANPQLNKKQHGIQTVEYLLELMDLDVLKPSEVRNALNNSGEYEWNGENASIVAAFDKNTPDKLGSKWLKRIDDKEVENFNNQELSMKAKAASLFNKYHSRFSAANTIEEDKEIFQEFTATLKQLEANPETANIKNYLDKRLLKIITDGGMHVKVKDDLELLREKKRNGFAVLDWEVRALPPWAQDIAAKEGLLLPWSKYDDGLIRADLKAKLLNRDQLDIIIDGLSPENFGYVQGLIEEDLVEQIKIKFNKYLKETGDPVKARQAAVNDVLGTYSALINSAMDAKSTTQEKDLEFIRNQYKQWAKPGILDANEISNIADYRLNLLSFNNKIIKPAKNSPLQLYKIFQDKNLLVGESTDKHQDLLLNWVLNGGKGPLPGQYKAWSRMTGIDIQRIAIYRANALRHLPKFSGIDDATITEIYKNVTNNTGYDLIGQLYNANSTGSFNRILLNQQELENPKFWDAQEYLGVAKFLENNPEASPYNFIQNINERVQVVDGKEQVTQPEVSELLKAPLIEIKASDLILKFQKGDFYNIGRYAIPTEAKFIQIYKALEAKGLINEDTLFDEKTQKLFFKQAVVMQSANQQILSGITYQPTTFDSDQLAECNLGNTPYNGEHLTQSLTEFCRKNLNKKE